MPFKKSQVIFFLVVFITTPIGLSLISNSVTISSTGKIQFTPSPPKIPALPTTYDFIVYRLGDKYIVENEATTVFSSYDATEVLQYALDSAINKKVLIKLGEYLINNTLYMRSNVTVVLEDGCAIKMTVADKWIIYYINVNCSYLTSNGLATITGLGTGGAEKGIVLHYSDNNILSNLCVESMAEELLEIRQSNNNVFKNIIGYNYSLGVYASHGVVLDSSVGNYLLDLIIDANYVEKSRSPLLLIGNYAPCTGNFVIGGAFKNSARDNGIYLCGYAYPVKNNFLANFSVSGNTAAGHAGLKLRAASNNIIYNFSSFDNYNGVEVGTDMTIENPLEPNSTENYIQGICRNNKNVGLIIYIDKERRAVANNIFDLLLANNGNNGIWIAVEFAEGIVENNVFYVSSINNAYNGIGVDITVSSGYVRNNYFKGVFSNNSLYGIRLQNSQTPEEYAKNFVDNRFDVVLENNSLGNIYGYGTRTCINKYGEEDAAFGNPPTSAFWKIEDIVKNINDGTYWIKDEDGIMKPLAKLKARFTFISNRAGFESNKVQFIDQSFDPTGKIIAWNWDFGDGSTSDNQNPTHIYNSVGNYNVTLIVMNWNGTSSSVTLPIRLD